MPISHFHPAVADWFAATFPAATSAQAQAWRAFARGDDVLVAAPTGSGKTLAAFLGAIDALVRQGLDGALPDETQVVYVSPLKALSNDIRINLEAPIEGIRAALSARSLPDVDIRTAVRTGDTPEKERIAMRKRPPHIVVTTPESLYILLGSESGRAMLATTRTVIVDEIHALAPNKRGSHLALTIERLQALCGRRLGRIGLSATQKPIDDIARFLVGTANLDDAGDARCRIVDVGYGKRRDLAIDVPPVPLTAVMATETWSLVYDRLAALAREHRTTLVFVNTRRMAERAARHLSERLGRDAVAAHHGSLAREQRLDAEQRLKRGELRVLVATSSLELGIDIGDVELVCQLGSPRAISAFLQRVGRSGHAVGGVPKGRLFPQSRDDLVECAALLDAVRRGELDAIRVPPAPLDVLSQQIVAEVACGEWREDALFELVRRAWPFATLARSDFDAVMRMLASGFTTRRGSRAAWLHRDAVHGAVRARRGARMTAITSGGAIPDTADYDVVLEPQAQRIGSVNEDFAVESLAGDVFQLGNASYRILRVEQGRVRVEDAQGSPPSIPFWLGEAPGRSDELSAAVSRLRAEIAQHLDEGEDAAHRWLTDTVGLSESAARQLIDYLSRARAALGVLPTLDHLAMERFFDESGGTQLVIHSPYGSRINRAWGLALRKRFCRSFNFELQAAATEDAIVLSLSTSHSFALEEVARYLHSNTVTDVLTQALLDAPMFGVRWRWIASISLALPRFGGGRKVAPQLLRMRAEDLLATVFPDQVACAENIVGEREIPDHPLVAQTLHDCLHEAMDLPGLIALLRGLESGAIRMTARDLPAPSPLAAEVLTARPYAYLDDAPIEERRTQAVAHRGLGDADDIDAFGRLDPDAIASVREQAWPRVRDADEMHEALAGLGCVTDAEATAHAWTAPLDALAADGRATRLDIAGRGLWVAAERLPLLRALFVDAAFAPVMAVPAEFDLAWTREDAALELLRSRLTGTGPITAARLADDVSLPVADVDVALLALEREGFVLRGRFEADVDTEQWCERHLLARIHRYTVGRLRREIEPVDARDLARFLFEWQRVAPDARASGPDGLAGVLAQLEGFEAAAGGWESHILPARVRDYDIAWLDELCRAGRIAWARVRGAAAGAPTRASAPVRATPITLVSRRQLSTWATSAPRHDDAAIGARAQRVADALREHGALFFDELAHDTRLLRTELEDALGELVAVGRVSSDSFAGLRALLLPPSKRGVAARRRGRTPLNGLEDAGRWSLVRPPADESPQRHRESVEHIARTLLRRWGVVFPRLLAREARWLPPWRELLRVYQRLEARGEIRGGRFVNGFAGEQFALPDAVGLLRRLRRSEGDGTLVRVSGVDPLNLVGDVLSGTRVPALVGNRVLYRDGVPVATLVAGDVTFAPGVPESEHAMLRARLIGPLDPAPLAPPPMDVRAPTSAAP